MPHPRNAVTCMNSPLGVGRSTYWSLRVGPYGPFWVVLHNSGFTSQHQHASEVAEYAYRIKECKPTIKKHGDAHTALPRQGGENPHLLALDRHQEPQRIRTVLPQRQNRPSPPLLLRNAHRHHPPRNAARPPLPSPSLRSPQPPRTSHPTRKPLP